MQEDQENQYHYVQCPSQQQNPTQSNQIMVKNPEQNYPESQQQDGLVNNQIETYIQEKDKQMQSAKNELTEEQLANMEQNGFIRKVLIIHLIWVLVVILLSGLTLYIPQYQDYQQTNMWLFYTALSVFFVIFMIVIFYRNITTIYPANYILLSLFTLSTTFIISFFVGMITSIDDTEGFSDQDSYILLIFAVQHLVLALSSTLYAFCAKKEEPMLGARLFCYIPIILIIFGIFEIFNYKGILANAIAVFSILLFYGLFVYDLKQIVQNKRFHVSMGDFIFGGFMLQMDVMTLFSGLFVIRRYRIIQPQAQ